MNTKIWIYKLINLIIVVFGTAACMSAQGESKFEDTEVFTITSLSSKNLYVGVPVCYSVRLYSTNPSIDFVRPISKNHFEGFDIKQFPTLRTDRYHHINKEIVKGRTYYTVWLEDIILVPQSVGDFNIKGEDFIAGINEYQVYSDPFWGTMRRAVPSEYPIKGQDMKVKVSNFPSNQPKNFSGATGVYSVKVNVNKIVAKEDEAVMVVRISGQGDLSDVDLPNLLSQFPNSLGVKSVSQDCNTYMENGVLRSDLYFECGFSPIQEGIIKIPAITFTYFNPDKKKFVTAESEPIDIEVRESVRKTIPTEIMEL
ncbi:MAG: hypothetical protein NC201_05170 [Prevotella sp.]|nr:hypothetical protein [Bacteroides sp.]MCM1366622.1 hypothetical protein [Prevotella sp.]MCM1436987.1 hypothetical protein [Prevotella sp.]